MNMPCSIEKTIIPTFSEEIIHNIDVSKVLLEANNQVENLLTKWIIEQALTQEEIEAQVDFYIKNHREDLLHFLWNEWKVLIVMNSANKFWTSLIDKLGIPEERVERVRVQTYENWESSLKELSEDTKNELSNSFWKWSKVLVVEDMIDTWNTLSLLNIFFINENISSRVLCLFDKNVEQSNKVKDKLWDDLSSIINIWNEFIVWHWIDYSHRLLATLEWLYKVTSVSDFLKIMNPFRDKIANIIKTSSWK